MESYTKSNYLNFRELRNLKLQLQKISEIKKNINIRIKEHIDDYDHIESFIANPACSKFGTSALEIGHGQIPLHAIYLSTKFQNVHGVDLDVVPESFDVQKLLEVLKINGMGRFSKTLFRELSGLNKTYRNEICRQLGQSKYPELNLLRQDISSGLPYSENSMNAVYSSDVFEHLEHPKDALMEIKRVLKDGCPFVMKTLHWGHYNALHDLGLIVGEIDRGWLHLLENDGEKVYRGTYVNTVRINDWINLMNEVFVNVEYEIIQHEDGVKEQLELIYSNIKKNATINRFSKKELFASHLLIKGYK